MIIDYDCDCGKADKADYESFPLMQIVQSSPGFRFYSSGFFFFLWRKTPKNCHFYGTWQDRPHGGCPMVDTSSRAGNCFERRAPDDPILGDAGCACSEFTGNRCSENTNGRKNWENIPKYPKKYPKISENIPKYPKISKKCPNYPDIYPDIPNLPDFEVSPACDNFDRPRHTANVAAPLPTPHPWRT